MPLLPTLSLLLSLLVCGAIFRLYAWRATLSLKALSLMFGLGAVGASVASLYLQNFPMPFLERDGETWRSVVGWTTGPLYEEVFKAAPAIILMLSARVAGRMSVADFALAGFAGGLGFAFVELNMSRVISGTVTEGWEHVWALGYTTAEDGRTTLYWPGHYVYSALVGLGLGVGARLWPNDLRRWGPGLAVLVFATYQHIVWNYVIRHSVSSLVQPEGIWGALYGLTLNGLLEIVLLPVAVMAASAWETRWLAARGRGAGEDLALPGDDGRALSELRQAWERAPYGREAFGRLTAYFRTRRAVALAEAEAVKTPDDPVAAGFAALARKELVEAKPLLLDPQRGPWWPSGPSKGALAAIFKRYRLLIVLGVLAALFFAVAPKFLPWLHAAWMRDLFVVAGAGIVVWRVLVYRRAKRPDPASARGEALATRRLQFTLLCTSAATSCLSLMAVFLHIKGMTPGVTAYVIGHFSRWADQGGSPEALLALAAALGSVLATPDSPDDDTIDPALLIKDGGPATAATTADEAALTDAVAAESAGETVPGEAGEDAVAAVAEAPAAPPAAPAGPPKTPEELQEEEWLASLSPEERAEALAPQTYDPNSPKGIMERAKKGDPEAIAQWEALHGKTWAQRIDEAISDGLSVVAPALGAAYDEVGGLETLREAANLDWGKEVKDTASALHAAAQNRMDQVVQAGWDAAEAIAETASKTVDGIRELSSMDMDELRGMGGQLKEDFDNSAVGQGIDRAAEAVVAVSEMSGEELKAAAAQVAGDALNKAAEVGEAIADKAAATVEGARQLVEGMTLEELQGHVERVSDTAKEGLTEAQRAARRKLQELWRTDPEAARKALAEGTIAVGEELVTEVATAGMGTVAKRVGDAVDAFRAGDNAVDGLRAVDKVGDGLRGLDKVEDVGDAARTAERASDARRVADDVPTRRPEAPDGPDAPAPDRPPAEPSTGPAREAGGPRADRPAERPADRPDEARRRPDEAGEPAPAREAERKPEDAPERPAEAPADRPADRSERAARTDETQADAVAARRRREADQPAAPEQARAAESDAPSTPEKPVVMAKDHPDAGETFIDRPGARQPTTPAAKPGAPEAESEWASPRKPAPGPRTPAEPPPGGGAPTWNELDAEGKPRFGGPNERGWDPSERHRSEIPAGDPDKEWGVWDKDWRNKGDEMFDDDPVLGVDGKRLPDLPEGGPLPASPDNPYPHNPLEEGYAKIRGAERQAPDIGRAEERIPGGRDRAMDQVARQHQEGLDRAREGLARPEMVERMDPKVVDELRDAVANPKTPDDLRRMAGMEPRGAAPSPAELDTPTFREPGPSSRPPGVRNAGDPPHAPDLADDTPTGRFDHRPGDDRPTERWNNPPPDDTATRTYRRPEPEAPRERTGPGETERLEPRERTGPGETERLERRERTGPGETERLEPRERTGPGETERLEPRERTGPGGTERLEPRERTGPGETERLEPRERTGPGETERLEPRERTGPGETERLEPRERTGPGETERLEPRERTGPGETERLESRERTGPGETERLDPADRTDRYSQDDTEARVRAETQARPPARGAASEAPTGRMPADAKPMTPPDAPSGPRHGPDKVTGADSDDVGRQVRAEKPTDRYTAVEEGRAAGAPANTELPHGPRTGEVGPDGRHPIRMSPEEARKFREEMGGYLPEDAPAPPGTARLPDAEMPGDLPGDPPRTTRHPTAEMPGDRPTGGRGTKRLPDPDLPPDGPATARLSDPDLPLDAPGDPPTGRPKRPARGPDNRPDGGTGGAARREPDAPAEPVHVGPDRTAPTPVRGPTDPPARVPERQPEMANRARGDTPDGPKTRTGADEVEAPSNARDRTPADGDPPDGPGDGAARPGGEGDDLRPVRDEPYYLNDKDEPVFVTKDRELTNTRVLEPGEVGQGRLKESMKPYIPSQADLYTDSVNDYAQAMIDDAWDWKRDPTDPIRISGNQVVSGHHRLAAAQMASDVTKRPLIGGKNAIIPDHAIEYLDGPPAKPPADWGRIGVRPGYKPDEVIDHYDEALDAVRRDMIEAPEAPKLDLDNIRKRSDGSEPIELLERPGAAPASKYAPDDELDALRRDMVDPTEAPSPKPASAGDAPASSASPPPDEPPPARRPRRPRTP